MNIDPRTIKELLQLQILSKSSLLSSSAQTATEDDTNFSEILNSLLSSSASSSDRPLAAAGTIASSGSLQPFRNSYVPVMPNGAYASVQKPGSVKSAGDLEALIESASRKHSVQSSLVKAVIDTESSFNPRAVSGAGAKGLMQLMDGTSRGLGVTNPFDPAQNINGGTQYLAGLLQKYNGNRGVALAAYNAGPGRIDRLGITNDQELKSKMHLLPSETQAYVGKVLRLQRDYEA